MKKNQYKKRKDAAIYGVDEAWRGAWAGPVVAACVFWSWKIPITNRLRDSKLMSSRDRQKAFTEICSLAQTWELFYGIGIIDHAIIDAVGIREANRRAMEQAIRTVHDAQGWWHAGWSLLIDGRDNYAFDFSLEPEYIIQGDSIVPQIMAASIVAKVTRDWLMTEQGKCYEGYGFERHKWYGTKFHQDALRCLGILPIHRKSYAPIKLATFLKGI